MSALADDNNRALRLTDELIRRSDQAVNDVRKPLLQRILKALKDDGVPANDLLSCAQYANEQLCVPPLAADAVEFQVALATGAALAPDAAARVIAEQEQLDAAEKQRYRIAGLNDTPEQAAAGLLRADDVEPVLDQPTLIKGLITPDAVSLWYGPSNVGKSFVVLDMAAHIAIGRPWFGRKTQQTGVLYFAAEGWQGFKNRVAAVKRHLGADKLPLAISNAPLLLASKAAEPIEDILKSIAEAGDALGQSIGLIIVDTLNSAFAGGNENDTADMTVVNRRLVEIRDRAGVHIVLIHHSGKDVSKGARGSSALPASVDSSFEFTEGKEIWTRKQRDLPKDEAPITYDLRTVELGRDKDGEPVTSCVVDRASTGIQPGTPAARALAILQRALEEEGTAHEGRTVILESRWRELCQDARLAKGDKPAAERQAYNRAKKALEGHVTIKGGRVWIATATSSFPSNVSELFPDE